jgi:hypothetical protein
LLAEATERADAAGDAVDTILTQHAGQRIATQPVLDALTDAKAGFISPETQVVLDSRVMGQLGKLEAVVAKLGPEASVQDLVAVRRVWDDIVSRVGGFTHRAPGAIGMPLKEQTEAWAKREGANAIRRVLADEVPDLAIVNKEYHFWKGLEDVLRQTVEREGPQKAGLRRTILTAAGMTAGASTGTTTMDRAQNMFIYGSIANRMSAAFLSPRWKLVSAKARNDLADAIASGNKGRIAWAMRRIVPALGGKVAASGQ